MEVVACLNLDSLLGVRRDFSTPIHRVEIRLGTLQARLNHVQVIYAATASIGIISCVME
jgi:hypothetical protein